jgi:hypothetical protein
MARDLVGTLRTLASLDLEIIDCLREEGRQSAPGSARARLIEAALAGLSDPLKRPDGGGILPGRGWRGDLFELTRGYRR